MFFIMYAMEDFDYALNGFDLINKNRVKSQKYGFGLF